jgi:hypothetical protein
VWIDLRVRGWPVVQFRGGQTVTEYSSGTTEGVNPQWRTSSPI